MNYDNILRKTVSTEATAIMRAYARVRPHFSEAVEHLLHADTVLFSGMGKSSFIARKAASTLRSMGQPAYFLHPAETSHGDLGAIVPATTCVVILSHSGDTPELLDLIRFCQTLKVPIVGVTGNSDSGLARAADTALCYGSVREACPNGLAPTTSTSVALSLCDALCVAVATHMGTTRADFLALHPGGKLGDRLRPISEIMRRPSSVHHSATLLEAAVAMTEGSVGVTLVMGGGFPRGIITDGDLRRAMKAGVETAGEAMSRDFIAANPAMRVEDARALMQEHRITKLAVVDEEYGDVVGIVNLHDCE